MAALAQGRRASLGRRSRKQVRTRTEWPLDGLAKRKKHEYTKGGSPASDRAAYDTLRAARDRGDRSSHRADDPAAVLGVGSLRSLEDPSQGANVLRLTGRRRKTNSERPETPNMTTAPEGAVVGGERCASQPAFLRRPSASPRPASPAPSRASVPGSGTGGVLPLMRPVLVNTVLARLPSVQLEPASPLPLQP